jgi:hypothetical protein
MGGAAQEPEQYSWRQATLQGLGPRMGLTQRWDQIRNAPDECERLAQEAERLLRRYSAALNVSVRR